MDILELCEIHEVSHGPMIHTQLVFCSAIFVLQIFVPHFCSTDLFALALWVPKHPISESPHQFLFRKFLFRFFVPLNFLHLALGSPTPDVPRVPTNFLFRKFLFRKLVPHFCSADLFALSLGVPNTRCPKSPHQFLFRKFLFRKFLFRIFVPLTFLHLALGSPTPDVRESPPIFCSANFCSAFLFRFFVPLTFLHLALGSPTPNVRELPTNFCSAITFLHCPHHFLFRYFCSADLFALTTAWGVPVT